MKSEYLPIGSVITMQGARRKLMIIGTGVQDKETGKCYDYIAVPYPEGYLGAEAMFLCNHADIDKIDYLGFVNAEFQAFRAKVSKA
jgi:hypothetical protein